MFLMILKRELSNNGLFSGCTIMLSCMASSKSISFVPCSKP